MNFLLLIWKYKNLIAIGLTITLIGILWLTVQNLREDKADLKREVGEYQTALKASQEASKAKIAALEKNAQFQRERSKALSDQIERIRNSEEDVDCTIPDFVIDAIRM